MKNVILKSLNIDQEGTNLEKQKHCPNCGFEGLMVCWKTLGLDDVYFKCPNCKFTFSNKKK